MAAKHRSGQRQTTTTYTATTRQLAALKSRLPNAAAEVDRNILTVEDVQRCFRASRDFGIAEVRVVGAEWVPL